MDDFPYEVASTERVKNAEVDLAAELAELKSKIEENEVVFGIKRPKNVSSVPLPKDMNYFRKEREIVIKRGMEVCEARPLMVQANVMQEEMEMATRSDHTPASMALLLHQHFLSRMHELVQGKHMHMLRWARFHQHTSSLEQLYPAYQDRLRLIMSEYNDCIQRAHRLGVSRESYFADDNTSLMHVTMDDMLIYLRWLICHLHSVKRFHQYMQVLQWLPVIHKEECIPSLAKDAQESDEYSSSARIPSKYQDDPFLLRPKSSASRPNSASTTRVSSATTKIPSPPPLIPGVVSTHPLPASHMTYALAAAGGGMASDEDRLCLPLHDNALETLRPPLIHLSHIYSIEQNVEQLSTSAEEMELFASVNRKFRQVFSRQQHMCTFKTYDKIDVGQENWGVDSSTHALQQEANWLSYVTLKPEREAAQETKMMELRTSHNVDELLRVQAKFLHVTDSGKIQDTIREHAAAVRDPIVVQPVQITGERRTQPSPQLSAIWKRIYTNPELFRNTEDTLDAALQEMDDKEAADKGLRVNRASSARKRRESYDYSATVQSLGLDEGETDSNDPASLQGAYVSFLQLRHLRIRDLQRTCLSMLNYFRSVERTITINDGGLSLESGKQLKKTSPQDHRREVVDGGQGGGGGLGSHHYIHYTPTDFKLSEAEFMEFSEVENHDDFYIEDEGRVHVQDQRGYYVVYDAATADLESLESDLLLVATHYIEKDRDIRNESRIARSNSARKRQQQQSGQSAGAFDIGTYGHQEVDRFAVLLDIWSNEAAFLECKKEVLDCYLEAYHHVSDRDEKRSLAQVIVNLMYQRPQFDFTAPYFVRSYRLECINLRLHTQLVKCILDKQIEDQREYTDKVCRHANMPYGVPPRIIPKQPISVNMSRSALKNVYLLEFHPSLAVISRLPGALNHAFWELHHAHKPDTISERHLLQRRLMEVALREWTQMDTIGAHYSPQVQKDVFCPDFVEDPFFMVSITEDSLSRVEQDMTRKSNRERQTALINCVGRMMDMVSVRHRLIDAAWEVEILSEVYQKQAVEMHYDKGHMYLGLIQFEFATTRPNAGKPPPIFITAIQDDDTGIDKRVPNHLPLAIHELDEKNVGHFSFSGQEAISNLLKTSGLESLQVALQVQVLQKNALISAVSQANACLPSRTSDLQGRPSSPVDTKSEKSSATAMTGMSIGTAVAGALASKLSHGQNIMKRSPEAFVSLQLEKAPSRDLMLNEFITKKASMETMLRNPEEMAKLKRRLIMEWCEAFHRRIAQYSLRSQIITYYNSMQQLLDEFPAVRKKYFELGEPCLKRAQPEADESLETQSESHKRRPSRVLTKDGRQVLNVWYLPHYTEVLHLYKRLGDEDCRLALSYHLRLVSALHDILQYLCAHARLGSATCRLGSQRDCIVTADWGGTEGVGTELFEIQRQIDHLQNKINPEEVAQFLALRRDVMFLEFDAAVRHSIRDTFLSTGNQPAWQAVTNCMHFALHDMSNAQHPAINATYLPVPEPLEPRDSSAWLLFPWRTFINRDGPYPAQYWQFHKIHHNMQLCLAGLKDVDRHVANGEILGLSLLMEDVLMSGQQDRAIYMSSGDDEEETATVTDSKSVNSVMTRPPSRGTSRPGSSLVAGGETVSTSKKNLSRSGQPLESYRLLRSFLLLWKRLEVFKLQWGLQKLGIMSIDKMTKYRNFCKEYRKEMLFPILQSVARRYGQGELYDGLVTDDEVLVMPRGASEVEIRMRQLVKLLEYQECHMINELRKKMSRELNLVLAERQREEGTLPTDLWKRASMRESVTINKPHIADDFIRMLMVDNEPAEDDTKVTFNKEHLEKCFAHLAREVMIREKHNYESYSMYYENLLRTHHQLLYQKEQDVKSLKSQLRSSQHNATVDVQCQLADTSQGLLLEVTALRAKIEEMRDTLMHQEREVRDRVKDEYDQLIHNLFDSSFDVMQKFDKYRVDLVADVTSMISQVKEDTIIEMENKKDATGSSSDRDIAESIVLDQATKLRESERENYHLNLLLMKTKAMSKWKIAHDHHKHSKEERRERRRAEHNEHTCRQLEEQHQEQVLMLREQVLALRNTLKATEKECDEVRRELEKEFKVKKEKSHAALQKAQSQRQLEEARRDNIEKLLEELEDKDGRLQSLSQEHDKNRKMQMMTSDKVKKEAERVKKALVHERVLKLDAFQRVDELQTHVYDVDNSVVISTRPQTAIGMDSPLLPKASKLYSRGFVSPSSNPRTHTVSFLEGAVNLSAGDCNSLVVSNRSPTSRVSFAPRVDSPRRLPYGTRAISSRSKSRLSSAKRPSTRGSTGWPPAVTWPANRSLTPAPRSAINPDDVGKIQRPKTTLGRLRSRVAEQLLNDLDPPDHHETLIRLQQSEALQSKVY